MWTCVNMFSPHSQISNLKSMETLQTKATENSAVRKMTAFVQAQDLTGGGGGGVKRIGRRVGWGTRGWDALAMFSTSLYLPPF